MGRCKGGQNREQATVQSLEIALDRAIQEHKLMKAQVIAILLTRVATGIKWPTMQDAIDYLENNPVEAK